MIPSSFVNITNSNDWKFGIKSSKMNMGHWNLLSCAEHLVFYRNSSVLFFNIFMISISLIYHIIFGIIRIIWKILKANKEMIVLLWARLILTPTMECLGINNRWDWAVQPKKPSIILRQSPLAINSHHKLIMLGTFTTIQPVQFMCTGAALVLQ